MPNRVPGQIDCLVIRKPAGELENENSNKQMLWWFQC